MCGMTTKIKAFVGILLRSVLVRTSNDIHFIVVLGSILLTYFTYQVSCLSNTRSEFIYEITSMNINRVPRNIPSNVTKVILHMNHINFIRAGTFSDLRHCIELDLEGNALVEVRSEMWIGLIRDEILILSYNQIEHIEQYGFSHLPQLSELDLRNNKLTSLPADIFNPVHYPDSGGHPPRLDIGLHFNPLQCDSRLCWLKKGQKEGWITWWSFNTNISLKPQCFNKPGIDWDDITLECSGKA